MFISSRPELVEVEVVFAPCEFSSSFPSTGRAIWNNH